ncbi:hypothetical protein GCM10009716_22010 [Streptomyces sodiiphilus]|uniref:Histidine kinase/HSP90-like ATPase domain-containing protein n=1 Tax=Streptomyces sodiiphilus TaxID=226217 RepID=A0ABN2P6W8_9ACTN
MGRGEREEIFVCSVPGFVQESGGDVRLAFPPSPAWVRPAREAVRTALTEVVPAKRDLIETAAPLTSELVTNAVVASLDSLRPVPVGLYAAWTSQGGLRVVVQDSAPGYPQVPPGVPPPEEEHGRGLLLITLHALDWGVCHHLPGPGKAVWFVL